MKKLLRYGILTIVALFVCYVSYYYWKMRQIENKYLEEVSEELGFEVDRESLTEINKNWDRINQALAADTGRLVQSLDLKGKWYTNKWELHHTLNFENGMDLVIDNHVDTIYRYRYLLNGDTLWLGSKEQELIGNKIIKFTKDTLIFSNLLDRQEQILYTRIKEK